MIDIKKAEEEFERYTSNYDMNESHIERKVRHTFRVEELCGKIATSLEMNEEETNLAKLIGLLHDIARFEQYTRYKTYDDHKSIDHGDFGVEILEKDFYIRKYIKTDKYDEIIRKAILNHNKAVIGETSNERELLHCRIIRDADKLDIFYVILNDSLEATYPLDRYPKEPITKEVKEEFIKNHVVNYSNVKSCADLLVGQIGFIFDINYIYSLKEIEENNYINKMINRYDSKDKETIKDLKELKEIAEKYIQEKVEEGDICLKSY